MTQRLARTRLSSQERRLWRPEIERLERLKAENAALKAANAVSNGAAAFTDEEGGLSFERARR